jgi:phosphoribosyl 1,2-cyclic phosphate phosphodiesterase
MRITFLGTGAATSYPLAFCRCEFCQQARQLGGKDFRKRSSVMINDDLLIDMGPDILTASYLYHKPITGIRYCLQTHSHSDHFDAAHLSTRHPEYRGVDIAPIQIFGSEATLRKMAEMLADEGFGSGSFEADDQQLLNVEVFPVKKFQTFEAGRYSITAFPTDHDLSVESLLFSITENNFCVFYGTDTDDLPEETWAGFHDKKLRFNVVILDHTYGPGAYNGGHLDAHRFIEHIRRMKAEDLLSENARVLATHISHEGNPSHETFSEFAAENGYEVAYDGLVVGG